MQTILTSTELKARIELLELKAKQQEESLKYQWKQTYNSIKPQNLVRNLFNDLTSEPAMRDRMLNSSLGLLTGFISKKLVARKSSGIMKKLAGIAVQYVVTNFVANKFPIVKQKAQAILQKRKMEHNGTLHGGVVE